MKNSVSFAGLCRPRKNSPARPKTVAIILKPENLARLVFFIRSEKVMLDSDLARLYGVEARALNQAVARNRKALPCRFHVSADAGRVRTLRSQIVTSKTARGGRRYRPYAFI